MLDNQSHQQHVKQSSDRSFGFVFAIVFIVIAVWPMGFDWRAADEVRLWALAVAVAIIAIALLRPAVLSRPKAVWLKFGLLLNRITSPVLLGFLFFVVLTPVALVMRLSGKRLMNPKPDPQTGSYWVMRDSARSGSMRDQF